MVLELLIDFMVIRSGVDENTTQSQVDVAAGTTPYTLGFRKAYRVTNGNCWLQVLAQVTIFQCVISLKHKI